MESIGFSVEQGAYFQVNNFVYPNINLGGNIMK